MSPLTWSDCSADNSDWQEPHQELAESRPVIEPPFKTEEVQGPRQTVYNVRRPGQRALVQQVRASRALPRELKVTASNACQLEGTISPTQGSRGVVQTLHADDLLSRFGYSGTAGDRNQHVMSGRVV